jgi:hypothetical protein
MILWCRTADFMNQEEKSQIWEFFTVENEIFLR